MHSRKFLKLAEKIHNGYHPEIEEYREIALLKDSEVFCLMAGADLLRYYYSGHNIHLCTICNGKSGGCTENCAFCSQSSISDADIAVYPLLSFKQLKQNVAKVAKTPIHRYSIVTSGRGLSEKNVTKLAESVSGLEFNSLHYCASLGILDKMNLKKLKDAGISRYHHNLETSESFFNKICTTHTYNERITTIKNAKETGLSICAGGIFGIGETDEQVLELALTLKTLEIDSIPINFLTPVKGTPLEKANYLTPLRCLKIIALFRYVMPTREIIVCGGREHNLKSLNSMIFHAGASGIMTGNYLTTKGLSLNDDLNMLKELGFNMRSKNP